MNRFQNLFVPFLFAVLMTVSLVTVSADAAESVVRFGAPGTKGARQGGVAQKTTLNVIVPNPGARGENVLQSATILSQTGGAMMVNTARPEKSIAKLPVKLQYDDKQEDGARVQVTVGDQKAFLSLYDWELKPLAGFVDSGHHGAVSINLSGQGELVSLDAAFEQQILGLRFIQADLIVRNIILSQEYLPIGQPGLILGAGERGRLGTEQSVADSVKELEPVMSRTASGGAFSVLTDANELFTFTIEKGKLVVSGAPRYIFWNPSGKRVIQNERLNAELKDAWPKLKQANPLVIESMERSFRAAALFRFQKQKQMLNWKTFVKQTNEIHLSPTPTPTFLVATE